MKNYRLGNTITVKWTIMTATGTAYNLNAGNLELYAVVPNHAIKVDDFSVSGNVVTWTFRGSDQKFTGPYTLTLIENRGQSTMMTVDYCNAFGLVRWSCQAGWDESADVNSNLSLTSEIFTHQIALSKEVQDAIDANITEFNVSSRFPTGGIDGTNRYTLETAIAKIPESFRTVGIKCSFLNEDGKPETWEYQGGTITSTSAWNQVGSKVIGNIIQKIESFTGASFVGELSPGVYPKAYGNDVFYIGYKVGNYYDGTILNDGDIGIWYKTDNGWEKINFTVLSKAIRLLGIDTPHWGIPSKYDIAKTGFFLINGTYQDNSNYKTVLYKADNIDKAEVKLREYGSGFWTCGICTEDFEMIEPLYECRENVGTEKIISIIVNSQNKTGNYLFVTTDLRGTIKDVELFSPDSGASKIREIENKSYPYKARVIPHTDTVNGTEYENNNVNRTFNMLQVMSHMDKLHDIMICFGLNGPNGMFGFRGYSILDRENGSFAEFTDTFTEAGETVGPWNIAAVKNLVNSSQQKFTGGYHALINPETNVRTPSASNKGFHYYADGIEIGLGEEVYAHNIKCMSAVNIDAYNTMEYEGNTAREVLEYRDIYELCGDNRIHVLAEFTALEEINIELHYGLQTDKFNPNLRALTDDGLIDINYEGQDKTLSVNFIGLPTLISAGSRNGYSENIRMYDEGAMRGDRNNGIKAFLMVYPPSSGKNYHWVYGNGHTQHMQQGDSNFYRGYIEITMQNKADV